MMIMRLRPSASDNVPCNSIMIANGRKYAVSVCCICISLTPNSAWIDGNAGSTESFENGPSVESNPNSTNSAWPEARRDAAAGFFDMVREKGCESF